MSRSGHASRALVAGPEVLLMDEPTSALDESARPALEDLARELAVDGVPLLWVTHDLGQAARLADWVLALDRGRVRASGLLAETRLGTPARPEGASMAQGDVGALGVAASLLLVALAVALSAWRRLGLERSLLWAAALAGLAGRVSHNVSRNV